MLQLTIHETEKGLKSLLAAITSGGTISDVEKAALANAVTVFTKLSNLRVVDWSTCEATDNGEPIPETAKEVRTALFFSDVLDEEGFNQLMLSDEILDDPRALVSTPEKTKVFLSSLGFRKKHTAPGP